jgi:hypothetical protein
MARATAEEVLEAIGEGTESAPSDNNDSDYEGYLLARPAVNRRRGYRRLWGGRRRELKRTLHHSNDSLQDSGPQEPIVYAASLSTSFRTLESSDTPELTEEEVYRDANVRSSPVLSFYPVSCAYSFTPLIVLGSYPSCNS